MGDPLYLETVFLEKRIFWIQKKRFPKKTVSKKNGFQKNGFQIKRVTRF